MDFLQQMLENINLPKVVKIHRRFDNSCIDNIEEILYNQIQAMKSYQELLPGARIAIAVGSRGIDSLNIIVSTVVALLKSKGVQPFIIPAMGSHAGATAEGQRNMLESLGITEATTGAPILSSMEVVTIGTLDDGRPIYIDKLANNADGIIIINRIKEHTTFHGIYESGLMKMLTIGLGKQLGAQTYHKTGYHRMPNIIAQVGQHILNTKPVLFGVAITENAFGKINHLEVLDSMTIPKREIELLAMSKNHSPKLGVDQLDVLCVHKIGKDISGTGMNSNVVGRYNTDDAQIPNSPSITRICILDLTSKTNGSACGMGFGDIITRKLYDKFSPEQTYPNALTSTGLKMVKIPMIVESDLRAIQAAIKTALLADESSVRLAIIENTQNLECFWTTENVASDIHDIEAMGSPCALQFDACGNLVIDYK